MKNITLTIKDRLLLPAVFAANKDSMTEASVQRAIRQLIGVGADEAKEIELQKEPQGYIWNALKAPNKDFTLSPEQVNYLWESIYNLSKAHAVTQDLLPICETINSL